MGASRTTKPLSAHPAFPVIVALWFAALLGLGTFVVPPANFEGLVVGTGLDEWLPAATPPLGDTARLAISGIAALLGALLGLAIAARIRRVQDEPQTRSETAESAPDSPWLADDDDAAAPDSVEEAPEDEPVPDPVLDAPAPDEGAGTIPNRLAGRSSTSERDELLPDEAFQEEPERIFQASELILGDAADEQTASSEEFDSRSGEETPSNDEEDDLQRFAADRLVAGLPRVQRRNFDDNPLEDWSGRESVEEGPDDGPEFTATSESFANQTQDHEAEEPDFDGPQLVEEAEYEELSVEPEPDFGREVSPAEPFKAADVEADAEPETALPDFSEASLSELVARFDAALAAQRAQASSKPADPTETLPEPSAAEQSDDPVIAFLRREADRDRGAPGEPRHERADDPRAGLRNALDKLDKVSRKS